MHFWMYGIGFVLYTVIVFWGGTKYGGKLDADAQAELNQLRQRLANTVAGAPQGATLGTKGSGGSGTAR